MSINQITTSNTFGQLVTAVSAMIAISNNLVDGPQVQTNSSWTFTNQGVGVNVGNTALINTGNISILNTSQANITNETIGRSNISTANITTANIVAATITDLWGTDHHTANANVSVLLQVNDRANIFSANIESANIGTLGVSFLSASELTLAVLNASFANITTLSVTGTSQHNALVATLLTTDNCNVRILNASSANISNLTAPTVNASFANLTTASIGTLTISTTDIGTVTTGILNASFANITSANIVSSNIGFANISHMALVNVSSANITTIISNTVMAFEPTSNSHIATKRYVDTGGGVASNLVNKLSFNAKGDIVLGTGANTYATLNTGTNGQVLIVDTQTTTGMRFGDRASQFFRGLIMGTSLADKSANGTQLIVYKLDEVVMDDGEVITNWTTPANIIMTVSGAGGLDGGTANANNWYEVYAIRKRSDGTKNYIMHRALDRKPDQNTMNFTFWPTVAGATLGLGANTPTALANIRLAQSFTPNVAGPLTSIEIRSYKTGATANGNVWITLHANTTGDPDATVLATSRKMDLTRLAVTTASNLRFIFDTTANVALATSYFWVFNTDYPFFATIFANLVYSLANTTLNANGVNEGVPKGNTGTSWVDLRPGIGTFLYKTYVEANSNPVTMPAGYDQKCLISYAGTDSNTKIKEYHQVDHTINTYYSPQWASPPIWQIQNPEVVDLLFSVPPISCQVGFFHTGGGSPLIYSMGRFHALDLPTTHVEGQYGGGYVLGQGGGGTSAMVLPFWVEHQAVLVKQQTSLSRLYPFTITF